MAPSEWRSYGSQSHPTGIIEEFIKNGPRHNFFVSKKYF